MNRIFKILMTCFLLIGIFSIDGNCQIKKRTLQKSGSTDNLSSIFTNPPESAKPGVLWEWMGSNITKEGITNDLEALKKNIQ